MNGIMAFIIGILQITLLDFTLSGDNIGVIALATRNLPHHYAKKARLVGVSAAILLRILFACGVTFILSIQWLPVKLIGGLLLIKITYDFIKPHEEENEDKDVKPADKFWGAIAVIVIADVSMSLDNVLAIAAASNGSMLLIVFGIILNIPIIFFGSEFVAKLMQKHKMVIYLGGAILAHTAFKMFLEDNLIKGYIPHSFTAVFPWIMAAAVMVYGYIAIKRNEKAEASEMEEAIEEEIKNEAAVTEADDKNN